MQLAACAHKPPCGRLPFLRPPKRRAPSCCHLRVPTLAASRCAAQQAGAPMLALAALLGLAAARGAAAQVLPVPEAAIISNEDELVQAITSGVAHLVLTQHLNLSNRPIFRLDGSSYVNVWPPPVGLQSIRVRPLSAVLPRACPATAPGAAARTPCPCSWCRWCSACPSPGAAARAPPAPVRRTHRCSTLDRLQGDCQEAPVFDTGPPVEDLQPGQCVITLATSFLQWTADSAPDVWLDRLYLRYVGEEDGNGFVIWEPDFVDARLWMSGVTFDGDEGMPGALISGSGGAVLGALPRLLSNEQNCLRACRMPGALISGSGGAVLGALPRYKALLASRTFRAAWHHMAAYYHTIHNNQHRNIQHGHPL